MSGFKDLFKIKDTTDAVILILPILFFIFVIMAFVLTVISIKG